jgi:hypothetical protein
MSLYSHAKRHAADAMRYACFRSSLLDVAIATECNAPAFFTLGSAFAMSRNSDSDRLIRFGDGFLSAAVAHSDNIMHNDISIVFIDIPPNLVASLRFSSSLRTYRQLFFPPLNSAKATSTIAPAIIMIVNQLWTLPLPSQLSHLYHPSLPVPSQSGQRFVNNPFLPLLYAVCPATYNVSHLPAYSVCDPREHIAINANVTTDFFMTFLLFIYLISSTSRSGGASGMSPTGAGDA